MVTYELIAYFTRRPPSAIHEQIRRIGYTVSDDDDPEEIAAWLEAAYDVGDRSVEMVPTYITHWSEARGLTRPQRDRMGHEARRCGATQLAYMSRRIYYTDELDAIYARLYGEADRIARVCEQRQQGARLREIAEREDMTLFEVRCALVNASTRGGSRDIIAPNVQREVLDTHKACGSWVETARVTGVSVYHCRRIVKMHEEVRR